MEIRNVLWKKNDGSFYLGDGESASTEYKQATDQEIAIFNAQQIEASKPKEVTRLQMMDALIETLQWDTFMAMRAADTLLNERWLAALVISRTDPMVLSMGKTDAELDALFLLASTK